MRAPRTYVQPTEGKLCFLVSPRHTQPSSSNRRLKPQALHTHKHTGPNTQRFTRKSDSTLFFPPSSSHFTHSQTGCNVQNQNTSMQTHRSTTTCWSSFPENGGGKVVTTVAASFSHMRENLEPPAGGGSVFLLLQGKQQRPTTHTLPEFPCPVFKCREYIVSIQGRCNWQHFVCAFGFRCSFMWWRLSTVFLGFKCLEKLQLFEPHRWEIAKTLLWLPSGATVSLNDTTQGHFDLVAAWAPRLTFLLHCSTTPGATIKSKLKDQRSTIRTNHQPSAPMINHQNQPSTFRTNQQTIRAIHQSFETTIKTTFNHQNQPSTSRTNFLH